MVKRPNYDDLARIKNPRQRKQEGQVKKLLADIKKIDLSVKTDDFEQLKELHRELDGTYRNQINNWGASMYNYIKDIGFTYEYIDVSSLKDNLKTMKAKLRGLLFEIDPNAEELMEEEFSTVAMTPNSSGNMVAKKENELESLAVRSNMYDVIKGRNFDVAREYARIWDLFNSAHNIGPRTTPLINLIDGNIQFFPDSFKNRALSLDDFNDTYGFKFDSPNASVTAGELISYCEYVVTLCDHLWKYASISLDEDSEYLKDDLYKTVEGCMDELGLIAIKKDEITIFVDKDPAVIAVAELVDESLAYDVKVFIHKQTKGDLQKKKTILKFLADDIEPQRSKLNSINKKFAGNLFQMLQKFVRHNNRDNPYISALSPKEIEECYDDIYQMWLLAKLEIDNIERKKRVEVVLKKINE